MEGLHSYNKPVRRQWLGSGARSKLVASFVGGGCGAVIWVDYFVGHHRTGPGLGSAFPRAEGFEVFLVDAALCGDADCYSDSS